MRFARRAAQGEAVRCCADRCRPESCLEPRPSQLTDQADRVSRIAARAPLNLLGCGWAHRIRRTDSPQNLAISSVEETPTSSMNECGSPSRPRRGWRAAGAVPCGGAGAVRPRSRPRGSPGRPGSARPVRSTSAGARQKGPERRSIGGRSPRRSAVDRASRGVIGARSRPVAGVWPPARAGGVSQSRGPGSPVRASDRAFVHAARRPKWRARYDRPAGEHLREGGEQRVDHGAADDRPTTKTARVKPAAPDGWPSRRSKSLPCSGPVSDRTS